MSDQATQLRGLVGAALSAAGDDAARGPLREAQRESEVVSVKPQSVPRGVVSYGPAVPRPVDARAAHQRINRAASPKMVRVARAIAVASGKGGVGKSNLAVNLAVAMSARGLKVCLLDADLGLANADVLCNLSPRLTLEHVVSGKCRLVDAMMLAPGGFFLIPGASGVAKMADLGAGQRQVLVEQLCALERIADVILIDCGAGISSNVIGFAAAANTVLVATTPEPTAITDGYGMIKSLVQEQLRRDQGIKAARHQGFGSFGAVMPRRLDASIQLVVNMAGSEREGVSVFERMDRVARTFLNLPLDYGGTIPMDEAVGASVRQRLPFVLAAPDSPATRAIHRLAGKLLGIEEAQPQDADRPDGFFVRVLSWLGIVENRD